MSEFTFEFNHEADEQKQETVTSSQPQVTVPESNSNEFTFEFGNTVDESKEDPIEEPDNTTPILDEVVMPTGTIEEETVEPTSIVEEEEEEVYSTSTQTEMSLEQKFDPIILDLLVRDKDKVMAEISRLEVDDLTDEERAEFKERAEKANLLLRYAEERTDYAYTSAKREGRPLPSVLQTSETDEALLGVKANPLQMAMGYQERYLDNLDKAKQDLQYELNKTGIYANEARKASIKKLMQEAQTNDALDLNTINYIVFGGEFLPFYGAFLAVRDIPENVKEARKSWQEGRVKEAALIGGLMTLEVGASIFSAKMAVTALRGKFGTKSQSLKDSVFLLSVVSSSAPPSM